MTPSSPAPTKNIETKIRWASLLVALGLLIQLASLFPVHPLAFVTFLLVGCPIVILGIALYLLALAGSR
jgi:hypothetical protein